MTASFYNNFSAREVKVMEARHTFNSLRLAAMVIGAVPFPARNKMVRAIVLKLAKAYEITLMPILVKMAGG